MTQHPTDSAHYSGTAFDRAGERRRDDAWIAARLADPETRLVPVWRGRSLVRGEQAAFLDTSAGWHLLEGAPSEPIFLGIDERHGVVVPQGVVGERGDVLHGPLRYAVAQCAFACQA